MRRDYWYYAALVTILLGAALFRFYGLDWDRGYLFHPDERKILLVATEIHLPSSIPEFFSPDSPLNPKFFAYGSFPIYLLRALSGIAPAVSYPVPWSDTELAGLALLGRALSGAFDLGTIVLTFLLARQLYNARVGLVAAACVAVTVLHIQLSHFYAVDTLLTFLVVATLFFAARFSARGERGDVLAMSIAFGLAMATKVSAAPLVVPIVVTVARSNYEKGNKTKASNLRILVSSWLTIVWRNRSTLVKIIGVALVAFIITQPYALLDPIRYFGQVGTESFVARGWLDYPYTRQFADTIPFLYPIWQSIVWGMGLPLGILAWGGSALLVWHWWRERAWNDGFILSWALVYFLIVGGQYAKYPRYLLPLLPFLYLMAAVALSRVARRSLRIALHGCVGLCIIAGLVYSIAFISIYSREHPWLQISNWIYENIPAGSTLATEHWDDLLPLSMVTAEGKKSPTEFRMRMLPMYDADDAAKKQVLADTIEASDYIILASPRLYATISRLPDRYPVSSRYYRLLFGGQLGFELAAFARNDPNLDGVMIADDPVSIAQLPVPPLIARYWRGPGVWNWGRADESITVYDHPMPLVFKKMRVLSSAQIRTLLTSQ